MTRILNRGGYDPWVSIFFFKSALQAVLLFVSYTWVVTPGMLIFMGFFQDQVARRLTGRLLQRKTDEKWEYTLAAMKREEAGLQMMEQ